VRRLAPALLLLVILAAGCSDSVESFPCPGTPVATMGFTGTRTDLSCAETNSIYPATVKFTGTISQSASDSSAALCGIRPKAEPLVGTLVADLLDVSLDTRGALLGSCDPRCAVTVTQRVNGMLARDPGGAVIGFAGTLVDTATLDGTVSGASCGPCLTPCHATYLLTRTTP
jgi:hypothetical protein